MAKLSFLDQLDERQIEYADKIATKAKEMGVPPSLAIAIAYHESRLNPDVARGKSGEFGIMQVMPATGKSMGFTNKDLGDPDKNIEAGLKYLKQNLDAFGGDPKMATVGYNAGTDSPFFSGGDLPKITEEYVKAMKGYGAYDAEPAAPPAVSGLDKAKQFLFGGKPPEPDADETDEQREARMQSDMDAQEKRQAQLMGGAAGAGVSATRAAGSGAGAVLQAGANRVGQGLRAGMQGNVPPAPTAPPAAVPPGQSVMRQPIPSGGPDAGRLAAGQTGTMPYNYAKSAGLTDIEAGRALDMTKQSGGVHDLTTQRREGTQRIQQLFPGEKYVENPRFGGLLTPEPSVGSGPRSYTAPSIQAQAAQTGPLPIGSGATPQIGGAKPPPIPAIPTPVVPKVSGLDTVTNLFKGMMRPLSTVASTFGRYVMPPVALANAAGEGVDIMQQMRKPTDQMDKTGIALSGLNILGSGLSMFPGTAPVGIPMTLGAATAQEYRKNPDFLRQKMQGAANIPMLDEMTGPLP